MVRLVQGDAMSRLRLGNALQSGFYRHEVTAMHQR
jgi:hypothetical protein